ncbi:MAG: HEAT repeat domain-containing protein [Lentisphaeria bacterium]|nr:HEAT repeat domain-containing protein [Lentisphaeria bacterium]
MTYIFPLLLSVLLWGQAEDDFFKFEKIINPDRGYFKDYSDNEYDSQNPGQAFYVYILDQISKEPLRYDFISTERVIYATDESVRLQKYLYETIKDPNQLSTSLYFIIRSRSKTALEFLPESLKKCTDDDLRADLIKTMSSLDYNFIEKELKGYIGSKNKRVRLAAIRAYAKRPYARVEFLLSQFKTETDRMIQMDCFNLALGLAKSSYSDWAPYIDSTDDEFFGNSIRKILSFDEANNLKTKLAGLLQSKRIYAKLKLVESLGAKGCRLSTADKVELLKQSHSDSFASIRSVTAHSIGQLGAPELEPILLKLASDSISDVRVEASRALAFFPSEKSFHMLVSLIHKKQSNLTREAAYASLLNISKKLKLEPFIGPYITNPDQKIRLHIFRLIDYLKISSYNADVKTQLKNETLDLNQAAALSALVTGNEKDEPLYLSYTESEFALCREQTARAIGQFDIKDGYAIIMGYAQKDKDVIVRNASTLSMSRIGDKSFASVYLAILKRTNYSGKEFLSAVDRSYVCWALMRYKYVTKDISKRLTQHITQMVIQTTMGPGYDSNDVRISACWALVTWAKRNPQDKFAVDTANSMVAKMLTNDENGTLPWSRQIGYFAYQAGQFMVNKPMRREYQEPNGFHFNFKALKKRK